MFCPAAEPLDNPEYASAKSEFAQLRKNGDYQFVVSVANKECKSANLEFYLLKRDKNGCWEYAKCKKHDFVSLNGEFWFSLSATNSDPDACYRLECFSSLYELAPRGPDGELWPSCNCKQPCFWAGCSEPFKLSSPSTAPHPIKRITLENMSRRDLLKVQKFRFTTPDGTPWPWLPLELKFTDAQPRIPADAASSVFDKQFEVRTDANGELSVPLYSGTEYSFETNWQRAVTTKVEYSCGGKPVVKDEVFRWPGNASVPLLSRIRVLRLATDSFTPTNNIVDVAVNLGRMALIRVYEMSEGKKVISSHCAGLVFSSKDGKAQFCARIANGHILLPVNGFLADPNGCNVKPLISFEHPDMVGRCELTPDGFKLSDKTEYAEVEYCLAPKPLNAWRLSITDDTGNKLPSARLYMLDNSGELIKTYANGDLVEIISNVKQVVLFAPGYELNAMPMPTALAPKDDNVPSVLTLRLRRAPEVTLEFSVHHELSVDKALLRASYAGYPFIPVQELGTIACHNGKGMLKTRLDTTKSLIVVANDAKKDAVFPAIIYHHDGKSSPSIMQIRAPNMTMWHGVLDVASPCKPDKNSPAWLFWLAEIPGSEKLIFSYVSVSTDGKFSAPLLPGIKYNRFLQFRNPNKLTKEEIIERLRSGKEYDRCFLVPALTVPKVASETPETVSPGEETVRRELLRLVGGWML